MICEYTENMIPVGVTVQQRDQILFNANSPILAVKNQAKSPTCNASALRAVAPPLNTPISWYVLFCYLRLWYSKCIS